MGSPEEIATTAAFPVDHVVNKVTLSEASFITGQTLVVDGGMSIIDYPSIPTLEQVGHRLHSHSSQQKNPT